MVCQIDPLTGNLLGKFKASTKAISSMSVSPGESPFLAFLAMWYFSVTYYFSIITYYPRVYECL